MSDDDMMLDDLDAAYAVGSKVIEMADRLRTADKIVPGAQAVWCFEIEDQRYGVKVRIAPA